MSVRCNDSWYSLQLNLFLLDMLEILLTSWARLYTCGKRFYSFSSTQYEKENTHFQRYFYLNWTFSIVRMSSNRNRITESPEIPRKKNTRTHFGFGFILILFRILCAADVLDKFRLPFPWFVCFVFHVTFRTISFCIHFFCSPFAKAKKWSIGTSWRYA